MIESDTSPHGRQSTAGIAVLDYEGRIVRANKTLRALVQWDETLEGVAAEALFATPPQGHAAAAIRATLADRKPRLFTTRTAEPLIVSVRFVQRLGTRKLTRFLLHAEAAGLRSGATRRPLRGTVQPSSQRLAELIHDFNNLLGIIMASAESGRTRAADDPALRLDFDAIAAAAQRGSSLLRKLIAPEGDEGTSLPQAVDLNGAVRALSPLLHRVLPCRIALNVVAGSPPLAWLDPVGLDQVILNLVVNARDAMPRNGCLTLSTGRLDGDATLAVVDTGAGIPPGLLPTVLRPGVTTKGSGGGQGLGLASVFEIVRQSCGGLVIESAPGEGTIVRLHFPPEPASGAVRRIVLLVEDEALVRNLAVSALARQGWEVISAEGVASALAVVEPRIADIALIVADLSLPDGDGLALIQTLRTRRPGLPAVLTSGYPASSLTLDGHELRLLAKPYSLDSLVRTCAAAVTPTVRMS